MKAWRIASFGNLELADLPHPAPGPGQVLIKVKAVSLNYRDLLMLRGLYNPKLRMPRIPCSDGAGEIAAIGDGVTAVGVGDRVAGIFMQNWLYGEPDRTNTRGALGGDIDGMLAEYVVLKEGGVVAFPAHLSFAEASTLPCAAVTAWNALTTASSTRAGDTVVIQGTGGVSIFALQFAKLLGARVLGTSSSDQKLARARSLGLDAGVNYKTTPDWARWVLDQTGGAGADLVVEVGGAGTLGQSIRALRIGGAVAQIGILTGGAQPLEIAPILHKQLRLRGIYVGSKADFIAMNKALSESRMKPVIDREFAFAEAPEALRFMEAGSHFGKLVIHIP